MLRIGHRSAIDLPELAAIPPPAGAGERPAIEIGFGAVPATLPNAQRTDRPIAFVQFLLGRGPAYVLAQCRVFSLRLGDVVAYPLPRAAHLLYPLLRLPLWLWRRARRFGANEPLRAPKRR